MDALPLEFLNLPETSMGTGEVIGLERPKTLENCVEIRTSLHFEPLVAFVSTSEPEATAYASTFSTYETKSILDTGATKTVIGSHFVKELLLNLKPVVREQVQRCPCKVTFRFDNHGTLESQYAIIVPIGPLLLKIAIVPGQTPFLLSNTLLRAIEAVVDITNHTVTNPILKKTIPLTINERGLYLVDLNDLTSPAHKTDQSSETFVISNSKKEESHHRLIQSMKYVLSGFICQMNRCFDHTTEVHVDCTNDLMKTFLRDIHFMDAVHDCGHNALLVQSKTDALRNTLGCEPLPQNGELHLGCLKTSNHYVYLPCSVSDYHTEVCRFRKPSAIESKSLAWSGKDRLWCG